MKIIITSHGGFCTGILESYEMLAGKSNLLIALPLTPDDTGQYKKRLTQYLSANKTESILILCDLCGGTPYNESYAAYLRNPEKIGVVSGLNLGMLLETAFAAENGTKLDDLVEIAIDAGHKGIKKAEEDEKKSQEIEF
ncbi:PTS sugar transporter subunit IIA [Lactobacillus sp. ESL0791]|uniref:PTS sugar transporter subunit IIA n=1 Tax=Lactobacillus sp. ESL0791 TaxID=2983234 RepID=UPI0023F69053|nr:PTS sugar transporter subunit IIA [Lactobacillus sp. ESL0791]MDF7638258.1 PTS sugar transporter subunit IIA [Lactobacillus sp. ESL0791]